MSIESPVDVIEDLDPTLPSVNDYLDEGAIHIQNIKKILKDNLKNFVNADWALVEQIIASMNQLALTLSAPVGTVLVFYNSALPSGWSYHNTGSDQLLRVAPLFGTGVDAPGTFGGAHSVSEWVHGHGTKTMNLNISQIPAHSHTYARCDLTDGNKFTNVEIGVNARAGLYETEKTGSDGSTPYGYPHGHGDTLTTSFQPKYANILMGRKI